MCELHRPVLHYLGTETGQFQHFLGCYSLQNPGLRYNTRVCSHNTVNICINATFLCVQCRCQCHSGCIRTAPAKRSNLSICSDALKSRYDYDQSLFKLAKNALRLNALNSGLAVHFICNDGNLAASVGLCRATISIQHHAQQCN